MIPALLVSILLPSLCAFALVTSPSKSSSPQFAGCISPQTFKAISQADTFGLLSKQEDNSACMELCGNKRFSYSYYHPRSAQCHCTKTESIDPSGIESGCDHLGGCDPCQAFVTYLHSPLSFTSCYSLLFGKPFLEFEAETLENCLSICSTDIYDTEVVGVQSKYTLDVKGKEKGEGRWGWKCSCYSGRNQGASKERYKVGCGKESVWRFKVPRE
ncbi:hypothetical protein I302_104217 [Kwoniella bestiolae CBS 10118]|uniref:WSC domain-containing protein n=1 Tax=Kwoniella bestiolae CBS 10118 TaxID=1296100 RepID=A0A1B9GAN9_9TREE|nr:hypothetical protein I302_02926 [Kwoniella bestiolae CBS 10118]OCF28075.1 hypothetical protein I302_02926 [Kwoniella bestiolae CBS 10118]